MNGTTSHLRHAEWPLRGCLTAKPSYGKVLSWVIQKLCPLMGSLMAESPDGFFNGKVFSWFISRLNPVMECSADKSP